MIRTIDDNYTELNLRVTKAKATRMKKNFNRSDSDEYDSDNKYSKGKTTNYISKSPDYRSKLPSIHANANKNKVDSDDEDRIYSTSTNSFSKKKKVIGDTKNTDTSVKKKNRGYLDITRCKHFCFLE